MSACDGTRRRRERNARRATDPLIKSKWHEIANLLDRAAEELERLFDPDRRS